MHVASVRHQGSLVYNILTMSSLFRNPSRRLSSLLTAATCISLLSSSSNDGKSNISSCKMQILCRIQHAKITAGMNSTVLMLRYFKRRHRPLSRPNALSMVDLADDSVRLYFISFAVKRPWFLNPTSRCCLNGYAKSPSIWLLFTNIAGVVLMRSYKSDRWNISASCMLPTSPVYTSVKSSMWSQTPVTS